MKKSIFTLAFCVMAIFANAAIITITNANINSNLNWVNTNQYVLNGFCNVLSGNTLTIQEGTLVTGINVASEPGTLIINRGAKIIAIGTKLKPIVFTSNKPAGQRAIGDIGGVIICGRAPANNLVGGSALLEGGTGAQYGGTSVGDNSGNLQFVRIEYAGDFFAANNEINGLTLGAVGNGTKINNVQVSFGLDDAFEWFGGTVNSKFLVAYKNTDDDFDTDNGFRGLNQFGLGYRDASIADAAGQSNGFESDNNAAGDAALPKTSAVFSNYTMVGPSSTPTPSVPLYGNGALIRKNSDQAIYNTAFLGWPTGLNYSTAGAAFEFCFNAFGGVPTLFNPAAAPATCPTHIVRTVPAGLGMVSPFNQNPPNALLKPNSPLLNAADGFPGDANPKTRLATAFWVNVNYVGAFADINNWSKTWTEYDPQNFNYCGGCATRVGDMEDMASALSVSAYPNPSNSTTSVIFTLADDAQVAVSVVDQNGRRVSDVANDSFGAGENVVSFDASNLTPGLYIVEVVVNGSVHTSTKLAVTK